MWIILHASKKLITGFLGYSSSLAFIEADSLGETHCFDYYMVTGVRSPFEAVTPFRLWSIVRKFEPVLQIVFAQWSDNSKSKLLREMACDFISLLSVNTVSCIFGGNVLNWTRRTFSITGTWQSTKKFSKPPFYHLTWWCTVLLVFIKLIIGFSYVLVRKTILLDEHTKFTKQSCLMNIRNLLSRYLPKISRLSALIAVKHKLNDATCSKFHRSHLTDGYWRGQCCF